MLAGAAGRYGAGFRAARGFLTVPSLFGRPITSNLFISRSREDLGQETIRPFVTDKIDLTAEQRIRPRNRLEMAYSYNFQWNHTFDLHSIPGDLFPYDIAVNVARLTGTMLFDTRDDLVDATGGWFHSSNVEYASAALGSQVHFAKFVLQQYYYRSLPGNIVLAGAGRLGLAAGFGQELIPSERFFAGGPTSVRGYAQDALGPADAFGSVGGAALLVLNQEIRFPVLKWLGGVGFIDAGNAFASVADLSLGGLRPSVGLGARIRTPVVLIRIDFGIPLDRAAGEPRGRWIFSIGQVF
jgi:outer membrane protein assembly factor BamA